MDAPQHDETFQSVKDRLAEIAEAVDDENLSLDDALDLYEEAVALGLKVSDLLEAGITPEEIQDESAGQATEGTPAEAPEPVAKADEDR